MESPIPLNPTMPFADGLEAVKAVRVCLDLQQHAGLSVSRAAQQLIANGLRSSVRAITTRVTFVNRLVQLLVVHGVPASAALERALTAVREFHQHGPRPALWPRSAREQRERLRRSLNPQLGEFWLLRERALVAARRPPLQQKQRCSAACKHKHTHAMVVHYCAPGPRPSARCWPAAICYY